MQKNILSLAGVALLLVLLPACRDSKDEYRTEKKYKAGNKQITKKQHVKKYVDEDGRQRSKKMTIEEENEM